LPIFRWEIEFDEKSSAEYVVFITPTALQLSIFQRILRADVVDELVAGSTAESLARIQMLTKIAGSPVLLRAAADKAKNDGKEKDRVLMDAVKLLPERVFPEDVSLSGKLTALANLLKAIRKVDSLNFYHRLTIMSKLIKSTISRTPRKNASSSHTTHPP
jgi:hypothetical protein